MTIGCHTTFILWSEEINALIRVLTLVIRGLLNGVYVCVDILI